MKRLSTSRLLAITAFAFALSSISNTLEPAVLGHKVLQLVPDQRNTALGFTTFAGLIVAVLVQPIVGVFSDRTRSRWGRRLPYMVAGVVLTIACLYLIAFAPVFGAVVAGVLLIQLGSNTIQGPWQALIPDQVPEEQRGRASGFKAMLDILAFVVARQVAGQLVGRAPQWGSLAVVAAASFPAALLIISLIVTAIGARDEAPDHDAPPSAHEPHQTVKEALVGAFRVDLRAHPAFGWWFGNRMLFWAAFIALNTFLLFYLIDVVGLPEAEAQRFVGQISLVIGGALMIVSIPAGWLADRVGRKPLVVGSGVLAALGTTGLLVFRDLPTITLCGLLIGLAIGTFLSANWALVTDIVPRGEAARYLGVANIATAGGSALARFLGGALIDTLNRGQPTPTLGYMVMYGLAAAFFLLSALFVLPLPAPRKNVPEVS